MSHAKLEYYINLSVPEYKVSSTEDSNSSYDELDCTNGDREHHETLSVNSEDDFCLANENISETFEATNSNTNFNLSTGIKDPEQFFLQRERGFNILGNGFHNTNIYGFSKLIYMPYRILRKSHRSI